MMKMKLGKYLAAGKSWAGGNGIGRYQMRHGLALPKFISPRNPFKRESVVELVAPPVAAVPANVSEDVAPSIPATQTTESPTVVAPRIALTVKLRSLVKLVGELLQRAALFCLDHNPFSAIGKPKLPSIPRFGKPETQGELSLDKVKVLRSDLTHADLEVVQLSAGQK
jgi:hypothetical protein